MTREPTPTTPPQVLPPMTTMRGADLSFTLQLEAAGLSFSDGGRTGPVEQLLAARGANLVRIRLWVDPPEGTNDLTSALALARRANAAGCHIMLNLHYADFWADPFQQPTPRAWAGMEIGALSEAVRRYTADVLTAFTAQGTPPALVQVGNEVSNGMLWPTGRVRSGAEAEWDRLAALLAAGIAGVREVGGADVRTVVHTDRGGDIPGCERFFANLVERGVEFDVAGLSYFSWWHGTLSGLAANLDNIAGQFGRDVAVVETSYPWTLTTQRPIDLHVPERRALPEADRFPPTPEGQAAYFAELRATIDDVRDGAGLGFVAWEPAWLPQISPSRGQDNRFANLTMFDWTGAALPSLAVFRA